MRLAGGRRLGPAPLAALPAVVLLVLVEAEPLQVGLHARAVVVLVAVAAARGERRRLLLLAQDLDGVHALVGALAALVHGAAQAVVVVQRGGALRVGEADELRQAARGGGVGGAAQHLRPAHLHALLRLRAVRVLALTLQQQQYLRHYHITRARLRNTT